MPVVAWKATVSKDSKNHVDIVSFASRITAMNATTTFAPKTLDAIRAIVFVSLCLH